MSLRISPFFFWSAGKTFHLPDADSERELQLTLLLIFLSTRNWIFSQASIDRQYDGSSTVNIYSSSPKKRLIIDATLHLLNPKQKADSYTIYSTCKRSTSRGSPIKLFWWEWKHQARHSPSPFRKIESIWKEKRTSLTNSAFEFCRILCHDSKSARVPTQRHIRWKLKLDLLFQFL